VGGIACDSGNAGYLGTHLGSVAQALHRRGIPMVVASRFPFRIDASITVARTLYRELGEGLSQINHAVSITRQELSQRHAGPQWATLQLYVAPEAEGSAKQSQERGSFLPPPLPQPYLARSTWIQALVKQPGTVVGPSGSGKTTSATELVHTLRASNMVVLYVEVDEGTKWAAFVRDVVQELALRGDAALVRTADCIEKSNTPVALIFDVVSGVAPPAFARDLARFVRRLPNSPRTKLWVFGQEDALADLAEVERHAHGANRLCIPGLEFEAFIKLAQLHQFDAEQTDLYRIYQALSLGRTSGTTPRIADAILRLGSVDEAIATAASDDVLLEADATRFHRLAQHARTALGALTALTHAFDVHDAQGMFPELAIEAAAKAGERAGLLHPLGGGRFGFHETVRRNLQKQLSLAERTRIHLSLANVYATRNEKVLEAHHAELAGLDERSREAGRAAFFNPRSAERISARAIARGWVESAEALACIRASTESSSGWWQVLDAGMDDSTAEALLDWWRESIEHDSGHSVVFPAARVLVAARADLVPRMVELILGLSEQHKNLTYGASYLGFALRGRQVDDRVVLDTFESTPPSKRVLLAPLLRSWGTPRCLARWLQWVIETGRSERPIAKDLTREHIDALLATLPDANPSQILLQRDWLFGTVSTFLWRNREDLGEHVAAALEDDKLDPKEARVALRVLGFIGHPKFLDAARRWGVRKSKVQTTALITPLLVNETRWRVELEALVLDPTQEQSLRIAAFIASLWSGIDAEQLVDRIAASEPKLALAYRFTVAISFTVRPTLFALEMLIEHLTKKSEGDRKESGALIRAVDFADGPHAGEAAQRLLPLLAHSELRLPVLVALTALRQRFAFAPCRELAIAEAGTIVGRNAAIAACASRPTCFAEVHEILAHDSELSRLSAAIAARFKETDAIPGLLELARDTGQPWQVRRRALLSLECLPPTPEVADVIATIVNESSLLGKYDTVDGAISNSVANLLENQSEALIQCWQDGKTSFVELIAPTIQAPRPRVEASLRVVWQALSSKKSSNASDVCANVLEAVHVAHVQAAAVSLARAHNNVDLIERVFANHDSRWLIVHALVERTKLNPRTSTDADNWAEMILGRAVGQDSYLRASVKNVLESLRAQSRARPKKTSTTLSVELSAEDLVDHLTRDQDPPAGVRIGEIDDEQFAQVVMLLDPENDNVIERLQPDEDMSRIVLTEQGVRVNSPATRHSGRKGKRHEWRAYLCARYPARVPQSWLEPPLQSGFINTLITALADQGDPTIAREVLSRLPGGLSTLIDAARWWDFERLGRIADDALIDWVGNRAGSSGGHYVHVLAAFARAVTVDAVVPLLILLMRRIEGYLADPRRRILKVNDPWRQALNCVLSAKCLRDVPGAGAWLRRIIRKVSCSEMRMNIIDSMAAFPSMWWTVELEVTKVYIYEHRRTRPHGRADGIAQALFHAELAHT